MKNFPRAEIAKFKTYQAHSFLSAKLTKRIAFRFLGAKLTKTEDNAEKNSRENLQTYQTIASATLNFPELTSH